MTSPMRAYLLQAYLNRELDQLAEEEFELELLRDPALAELALADTALSIGLNETDVRALPLREQSNVTVADIGIRPPYSLPWQWAAAACFMIGVAGVVGYQLNETPQASGATLAYIDKQRAVGGEISVTLPDSGPLVLMVPVASVRACTAEISLAQHGTATRVKANADDFGYASIVLPPQKLAPGPLGISVRCEGSTQTLGEYQVDVLGKRR